MFTVEQRDALRERVLCLAREDDRVVAGAAVGSLAVNGGDRFSDLDLAFGIADRVPVTEVLDAWTTTLIDELGAVQLADLRHGPTIYRVFLLPEALQFDLSMTPAAQFRPAPPRRREPPSRPSATRDGDRSTTGLSCNERERWNPFPASPRDDTADTT